MINRMLGLLGLDFEIEVQSELFSPISADLYLGSRPKPEQTETLKQKGITHIVSCLDLESRSKVAFLEHEFETGFLPIKDSIEEDISLSLPAFFTFLSDSKRNAPDSKTLVHCEAGVSRSATLVLAHLMTKNHLSFYDAYLNVRSKRTQILPNIGFASQLQQYERRSQTTAAPGKVSSLARYLQEICHVPVEIELLQDTPEKNDFQAMPALQAIFGDNIPRAIQGIRL